MKTREQVIALTEQLRKRELSNIFPIGVHSGLFDEAADMIESLLSERDAAIQDLKDEASREGNECDYCAFRDHLYDPNRPYDVYPEEPCKSCRETFNRNNWKYQGFTKEG